MTCIPSCISHGRGVSFKPSHGICAESERARCSDSSGVNIGFNLLKKRTRSERSRSNCLVKVAKPTVEVAPFGGFVASLVVFNLLKVNQLELGTRAAVLRCHFRCPASATVNQWPVMARHGMSLERLSRLRGLSESGIISLVATSEKLGVAAARASEFRTTATLSTLTTQQSFRHQPILPFVHFLFFHFAYFPRWPAHAVLQLANTISERNPQRRALTDICTIAKPQIIMFGCFPRVFSWEKP